MMAETKKLTKTTEPLDVERTMQEIKEYLEKPKWTDTILNEERHLFDSPFKALIPAYVKRTDAMLGCDLFFIGLFEKIYFAKLIKEMKLSVRAYRRTRETDPVPMYVCTDSLKFAFIFL